VSQHLLDEEAMMGLHPPLQGALQLRDLRAQAPPSERRQQRWILLPIDQGIKHRPSTFSQDIGGYRRQFEIGRFQDLSGGG
jgi:hypothetical protein